MHNLTVLDDLAQESVDTLSVDGFEPCAVVETSPGNFQAWLKHHRTYETAVSTFIAQELARRYQAIEALRIGDASAGCPVLPIASRNTGRQTGSSLSFLCAARRGIRSRARKHLAWRP